MMEGRVKDYIFRERGGEGQGGGVELNNWAPSENKIFVVSLNRNFINEF